MTQPWRWLIGSAYGLVHGVSFGALAGNSAEGAVRLGVGGYEAAEEHDRELAQCLRGKGYVTEAL